MLHLFQSHIIVEDPYQCGAGHNGGVFIQKKNSKICPYKKNRRIFFQHERMCLAPPPGFHFVNATEPDWFCFFIVRLIIRRRLVFVFFLPLLPKRGVGRDGWKIARV